MDLSQDRVKAMQEIEMSVQQGNLPLSESSVKVITMNLENDGQPQIKPFFFEPYRGFLPEPQHYKPYPPFTGVRDPFCNPIDWAEDINDYFQTYLLTVKGEAKLRIRLYQKLWKLWEKSQNHNWHISGFDYMRKEHLFKCILLNNVIGTDTITREELLCICRSMIKLLRHYKDHLVAPVMILSLMSPRHGRILVAHYDGNSLVIGQSQLFDFQHDNIDRCLQNSCAMVALLWCWEHYGIIGYAPTDNSRCVLPNQTVVTFVPDHTNMSMAVK